MLKQKEYCIVQSMYIIVMVYNEYMKQRILLHCFKGLKPAAFVLLLEKERIVVSRVGLWKFMK